MENNNKKATPGKIALAVAAVIVLAAALIAIVVTGLGGGEGAVPAETAAVEETVEAPVREGDVLGYLVYRLDGEEIGRVPVTAAQDVEKAGFFDYWKKVWEKAAF